MTKARVNADNASADIQGVTAGTGLSGGGTSGTVTLTNDMATTIAAKGDLVVGTGNDTYAALTAGNAGDTLLADNSTSTGLRYNPQNALANPVINGGFDIWQRGTSFAVAANTGTYNADRWLAYRAVSGLTVSRQNVSDSINLPTIQYAVRVQRDSGNTSTVDPSIRYSVETANSIPFAGRTITFSFYARAGANYSPNNSGLIAQFLTGTGTDQNTFNGYTGTSVLFNTSVTLTTSWQRFALTTTLASTATEFGFVFYNFPVGTAGANDWFEVTGVQIDIGTYTASTAPAFRRSGGTLQGELAACKYYFRRYGGNALFESFAIGQAYASGSVLVVIPFETGMRATPVGAYAAASNFRVLTSTYSGVTPTSIATNTASKMSVSLLVTGASSLTAGNASGFEANNTLNATLDFSAEL
jgi:hypothetical protein